MARFPDLGAALEQWRTLLTAYDVSTATSLSELTGAPQVLIRPPRVSGRFGAGTADLTWTWLAVAPDSDNALADLGELLGKLYNAAPGAWTLAEPADLEAGELGAMPCYRLTITQTIAAAPDEEIAP